MDSDDESRFRCQYERCNEQSIMTYVADPTTQWHLCAGHRLFVRHALEHPEEGWRVEASRWEAARVLVTRL